MADEPISAYALLSDSQGSALVSRSGSIDWACLPRFDSPSSFARLLDARAGHWRISPTAGYDAERAYLDGTMVLRTVLRTASGTVALTDAMPFGVGEREHGVGKTSPHAIVRVVEGLAGEVEMDLELAIRPEYGLTVPLLLAHPGGLRTRGGPQGYVVSSAVPLEVEDGVARARLTVRPGQRLRFALRTVSSWREPPAAWSAEGIDQLVDSTIGAWRSWSLLHQRYDGPYANLVGHSGRVLQALTYAPTGAIVAAPTTSLPETIGGSRNWDYRFCWVRDASLTLGALWVAACPDEAAEYFRFFATAAGSHTAAGSALQILYGIGGERHIPEHELGHLDGYRSSQPVRIGNGAWDQVQLDVYGEVLDAACQLSDRVGDFDEVTAAFLAGVADTAAERWAEPDQGIWEVRGGARPGHPPGPQPRSRRPGGFVAADPRGDPRRHSQGWLERPDRRLHPVPRCR